MDSKQIESTISPPINIHLSNDQADIGIEKEKYSNEWITKLRNMLEADAPTKNELYISPQKNTQKQAKNTIIKETYEEINSSLDSDSSSESDISFLSPKRMIQEDKNQKHKRELYLQIGEEMNEKDYYDEDSPLHSNASDKEQDSEEIFQIISSEMEGDYNKERQSVEQSRNLGVTQMNVFERIKAFDAYSFSRMMIKNCWIVQSNLSLLCKKIVESHFFENLSIIVILFNCIVLALDDPLVPQDNSKANVEFVLLIFYTIEMGLKISAYGFIFNHNSYLRNGWNILDFIIVTTGFIPYFISSGVHLNAIRSLRVLRPLRAVSSIKPLKQILNTIFDSLPLLKDAIAVLFFFYLTFAIAGQQLFSGSLKRRCFEQETGIQLGNNLTEVILCQTDSDCMHYEHDKMFICGKGMTSPLWDTENFDTFGWSLLNVYIVVTHEGWISTMVHAQQSFAYASFLYFLPCILIGNMFLENLLMAIIQIKYEENESHHKHKQPIADDAKIYNIDNFKKWGIYHSNKDRYLKIEENRLKRGSQLGKIMVLIKNGAGRISKMFKKQTPNQIDEGNTIKDKDIGRKQQPNEEKNNDLEQSQSLLGKKNNNTNQKQGLSEQQGGQQQTEDQQNSNQINRNIIFREGTLVPVNNNNGILKQPYLSSNFLEIPRDDNMIFRSNISNIAQFGQSQNKDKKARWQFSKNSYLEFGARNEQQRHSIRIKDIQQISFGQNNTFIPKLHPIKLAKIKNHNRVWLEDKNKLALDMKSSSKNNQLVIPSLTLRSISKKLTTKYTKDNTNIEEVDDKRKQRKLNTILLEKSFDKQTGNTQNNNIGQQQQRNKDNSIIVSERNSSRLPSMLSKNPHLHHLSYQMRKITKKVQSVLIDKNLFSSTSSQPQRIQEEEIVIPSRKVESEDLEDQQQEEMSLLEENDDDDFLYRIELIDIQNQKLLAVLNSGSQIGNPMNNTVFDKQRDSEIEVKYQPREINIENMIKTKQPNETQMKQTQTSLNKVTNSNDFSLPSLPSLEKKSVSSQQQSSLNVKDNNNAKRRASGMNTSVLSHERIQNIFFTPQSMNKSIIKKGDSQKLISDVRSQNRDPSIIPQPMDKFKEILFDDEDFYDFKDKKLSNKRKGQQDDIIDGNEKKQQKQQVSSADAKQQSQQQNQTAQKQIEKENIINQVFSKDEGQLYKQLFLNKPLTAKVLFTEPLGCSEDVLPRENIIKREKRRQEIIERIKRIKFQIYYSADKRIKLKSKLLQEKKIKMEKNRKIPIKMSEIASNLVQQQARVYDISMLEAANNKILNTDQDHKTKVPSFKRISTIAPLNDISSEGTFNKSPSVLFNNTGKRFSNNQKRIMSFTNIVEGKTPENDQLRNAKSGKKHSLFNIEMANINLSKDASVEAGSGGNNVQNEIQENNGDQSTKQAAKKVVKSILKQKKSFASSKEIKVSSSRTSQEISSAQQIRKGKKKQGDQLIYNWDVLNAMQKVFPTVEEIGNEVIKQEELSAVFGDDLSMFTSILNESKLKLSLNSSLTSEERQDNTSRNSSLSNELERSLNSSFENFSDEGQTLATEHGLLKIRNSTRSDSERISPKTSSKGSSSEGEKSQGEEDNQDKNKNEVVTLDQFAKDGVEQQYIKTMKKQVKNLVNRGTVKIREEWSVDEIIPNARITKSPHSTSLILRSLNYNLLDSQQNIQGIQGIINGFRRKVRTMVQSSVYENILLLCVIFNTVIFSLDGLATNDNLFSDFNEAFTFIFAIDMIIKIIGLGIEQYVASRMNIFDGFIVALTLFDMIFLTGTQGGSSFSAFRSLRILRVFRVTRLLRQLSFMKMLAKVIGQIADRLLYIFLLLGLYIFIYTLIGMTIFGGKFSEVHSTVRMNFDSFLEAAFSVFNLVTIVLWTDILKVALRSSVNPFISLTYLISCIFIGDFIIMNLVLATLIGAFNSSLFEKEKQKIISSIEIIDDQDISVSSNNTSIQSSSSLTSSAIGSSKKILSSRFSLQHDLAGSSHSLGVSQDPSSNVGNAKKNLNPQMANSMGIPQVKENTEGKSDQQSMSIQSQSLENTSSIKKKNRNFNEEERKTDDDEAERSIHLFEKITCQNSLYLFSYENEIRKFCYLLSKKPQFESLILIVIILNSLKLIVDTYFNSSIPSDVYITVSDIVDICFSIFFTMESLIKIISQGFILDEGSYLRDSWSQLDFVVVVTSIIDASKIGVELGAIKILRLFRTLRPLRLLHHNKSMKLIVTTLLESIPGILNMIVVLFLVWLMFAILGVSLMRGKMDHCSFHSEEIHYNLYAYHQEICEHAGGEWKTYDMNFENVLEGMLTLFIYSTLEGWPRFSYTFIDASSNGPVNGGSAFFSIFIVVFILIGSFFSIDLFGAVLAFHYDIALRKNKNKYLSDQQIQWIELQRLILISKPDYYSIQAPSNSYRKAMWKLAESQKFEVFIMICVMCNIIQMALSYDTSPSNYDTVLSEINFGFTCIFVLESVIKLIAYGARGYFYKTQNKFDFLLVIVSLIDIIFNNFQGQTSHKTLSVGSQIARLFRVFKVIRVLRLLKQFEGLQKLLQTLIFAMPSLVNATCLLFLIYGIFSILACFLFSSYEDGLELNHFQNFSTFHRSFLLLFRVSTGEEWHAIMFEIIEQTSKYACFFFIAFIIIQQYVMMNLFVLIIIEQFEDNYINPDNPLNDFTYSEEDFKKQWVIFTRQHKGVKIQERQISEFYFSILRPLGFDYKNKLKDFMEQVKKMNKDVSAEDLEVIAGKFRIKQKQLAERSIMQMNIKCDQDGFVYYNELLYYCFKQSLFEGVFLRTEKARNQKELEKCLKADLILRLQERQTMRKLRGIKKHQAALTNTRVSSTKLKSVNPIVSHLFVSMCYNSWKKYSQKIQKNLKQVNYNADDISSESESDDYGDYDEDDGYEEEKQINNQGIENLHGIDNYYKSREDNLIQVDREQKDRKRQIVPRLHTVFLREKKQVNNQNDKQPAAQEEQEEQVQQFVQMPNADEIYKSEFAEDNPQIYQRRISIQKQKEKLKQEQDRLNQEKNLKNKQQQPSSHNNSQNTIKNHSPYVFENNFLGSLKMRNKNKQSSIITLEIDKYPPNPFENSFKEHKKLPGNKNKKRQPSEDQEFAQNIHFYEEAQQRRSQNLLHRKNFRMQFPPRDKSKQVPSITTLDSNIEAEQPLFKQVNSLLTLTEIEREQLASLEPKIILTGENDQPVQYQKYPFVLSGAQLAVPVSPNQLGTSNSSENLVKRRPSKFLLENLENLRNEAMQHNQENNNNN